MNNDFRKFAIANGVNGCGLDKYASYMNPTILEERQLNVTQMDVFSRLMMDKIIFLGTKIDSDVANIVNAQLLYLNNINEDDDITIYVNSPGGEVYSGLAIVDTMNYIKNDVITVCTGLAASMGAVILSSGTKGKRGALKHSRVMIHQPSGGCSGQATEIEINYKEIQKLKEELCGILAENSGQKVKKVIDDCERDKWMTAQEAKEYGLIDDIFINKK